MGNISARIRDWIERPVTDLCTVVWYDPNKVFASLTESRTPQSLSDLNVSPGPN